MELINRSPFAVLQSLTPNGRGREMLLVVVKATFAIDSGMELLPRQPEIAPADVYAGPPELSSIGQAGELALRKPAVDVVLRGHAWPARPGDRSVDVSLRLGKLDKTVRVFGDRVWKRGAYGYVPSDPEPIGRIPLVYERAYGGKDLSRPDRPGFHPPNPVGLGYALENSRLDFQGQPLPNLVDPNRPLNAPGSGGTTACFSWLAPGWRPRSQYAGTCDDAWLRDVMPNLPADFDDRFFNAAPADQILGEALRGGESCEVLNATPAGSMQFVIPERRPEVAVSLGDDLMELEMACDSVLIDADRLQLSLVWRGSVDVHQRLPQWYWTSVEEKVMAHVPAR